MFFYRGADLTCSNAWISKLGNNDLREATDIYNKSRKCLPSCEYQTISTSITSATYPFEANFHETKQFCYVLLKLVRICQNPQRAAILEKSYESNEITCNEILNAHQVNKLCTEDKQPIIKAVKENAKVKKMIFKYAAENFAILRVLISHPYYTLIIQDEELSYITYIGNIGGLLGLSMGLSFISIFEIVYCVVNIGLRKFFH
jgi:hypothetical protein